MRAGFSTAIITPPAGVTMSGYRLRRAPATGRHDDLEVRCALVEDGQSVFALVSLDLIGLDYGHAAAIKRRIAEKCGLQPERILLGCTHTHSGPDTLRHPASGAELQQYCRELYETVADCVSEAMDRLEPTKVSLAQGDVPDLAFNRRIILRDGSARLNLERIEESRIAERGPVDPTASIVLFRRDSRISGAIANFTLHATVLDQENLLFTRDWPGYLVDTLEDSLPGKPVVLFFNGAFGNINQIKTPGIWISTFEEAQRIGSTIAKELIGSMEYQAPLRDAAVHSRHAWITIPNRKARSLEQIDREITRVRARLTGNGAGDEERRSVLEKELIFLEEEKALGSGPANERIEIQHITIGELEIIGLPGEIFVEYGLELKRTSPMRHCLVFGNANGSAGYVPLPESFAEGAYETRLSQGSRLTAEAGPLILQAVERMRSTTTGRPA
jgi:neutral ceramidase